MRDGRLTLYLDWCQVRARDPFPLTPEQLAVFAADTGRQPGVGLVRVVLAEQARRGHRSQTPRRRGGCGSGAGSEIWLRAARLCPTAAHGTVRWTDAVAGRRDAVALVARWAGAVAAADRRR